MLILLSLFLLFFQTTDLPPAKMSAVDFTAVKQGPIKNPGCIPLFSREITFRVKNRSDKTVYIQGLKTQSGHNPFGYLIRLDGERNQWLNFEGNTPHRTFKEFMTPVRAAYVPDVYVLAPGRSMTFNMLARDEYLGSRVQRGIFVSFNQNEEPWMVTSEEFILR